MPAGTRVHPSVRKFREALKRVDRALAKVAGRELQSAARLSWARTQGFAGRLMRRKPSPSLLDSLRQLTPDVDALARSLESARPSASLAGQIRALAIKLQRLDQAFLTPKGRRIGAKKKIARPRRSVVRRERRPAPVSSVAAVSLESFFRGTGAGERGTGAGLPGEAAMPPRPAKSGRLVVPRRPRPTLRRATDDSGATKPSRRAARSRAPSSAPPKKRRRLAAASSKAAPPSRTAEDQVSSTLPAQPASRYANVELFDAKTRKRLEQRQPMRLRQAVRLQIDIGELSQESHVSNAKAFPDKKLPQGVYLDVMVSSTDFTVLGGNGTLAHGRFYLPADGGPAIAEDRSRFIDFRLMAPKDAGVAHCRIGYYFRNILVQSQQLTADIGQKGGFRIATDFTITRDLTSFESIPTRSRVSVLTNSNGGGAHQIVLRSVDPKSAKPDGQTFAVNEATLGETMRQLRAALSDRSPATRQRKREDLAQDLRVLAPLGWTLYTQLPGQRPYMFGALADSPESYVVQVLRPTTSDFVVPWALMYEIPLLSDRPTVCPLISNWDGTGPLVTESMRACPHGPHSQDVLCPFGFWGFRYAIEQLASSDSPTTEIRASATCEMVMAQTQFGVDLKALAGHMTAMGALLRRWLPNAQAREGKDKASIRTLLDHDLPLVYFYCHGERRNVVDPNVWLSVGQREILTAQDFIGWLVAWRQQKKLIWSDVRPLVFVNACNSVSIYPTTLVSYVDAFVGSARAAGVIGTEVKVQQELAASVAERFFDLLLSGGQTVEAALRKIRFEYLGVGNLIGLLYTPYCWADLRIVQA